MSVSSAGLRSAQVARAAGLNQQTSGRVDAGLQAHEAATIAEIDARMDDLRVIRATLVSARTSAATT
jgi:hypothetical protein